MKIARYATHSVSFSSKVRGGGYSIKNTNNMCIYFFINYLYCRNWKSISFDLLVFLLFNH